MNQSTRSSLQIPLRAFPGVALELGRDGVVIGSNGRLDAMLSRDLVGSRLETVLDERSVPRLRALLGSADGVPGRIELDIQLADTVERRCFSPVRDPEQGRLWLLEHSRDSSAETADAALNESDAQLVNTQQELAKKSARLSRLVEEVERKLEENERLSQTLQYQSQELEAQNEELLAMTEELHSGQDSLLLANQQLETRSRELQVALSARNRFYAAMSHELRTPINAVMGYNDLLLAGIYGPLSEQQELAVERSQRAARHLRELVNDVLDISKIELGKMELSIEEVQLDDLVRSVMDALRPLADSQGSLLHFSRGDCPGTLRTDPRCVRQILLNLISQAVKLGGGTPVFLQCSPAPGGVAIDVTDSGGGMSAADLDDVFEEFAPLGPSGAESPVFGTGLGLPVAQRLAALIGGRLDASTTQGHGNVFRLFLPDGPQNPLPTVV